MVHRTCLFQERLKQPIPFVEEDEGTEGGCGKHEKQVAVVLRSSRGGGGVVLGFGNCFKGHSGTTVVRAHGLFLTLLACLVSFASPFALQTFFFQSYRVGPHRDRVEIPISPPAAQFPP